ncbi:hypothetical protein HYC85_014975 [Camellia sinensis]|uniref:Uncharacterized protein n=1 Tax=Camellia sinensis TaxID=4442 RepID=A0A7J7HB17_CAMSI|nr:hypothetical protein HYC85_014975 [Camellia sinensis]
MRLCPTRSSTNMSRRIRRLATTTPKIKDWRRRQSSRFATIFFLRSKTDDGAKISVAFRFADRNSCFVTPSN